MEQQADVKPKRKRLAPPLTWVKDGKIIVEGEEYRCIVPYSGPLFLYRPWYRFWKWRDRCFPSYKDLTVRSFGARALGDSPKVVVSEIRDSAHEQDLRDLDLSGLFPGKPK